jgi:hypothetical protein
VSEGITSRPDPPPPAERGNGEANHAELQRYALIVGAVLLILCTVYGIFFRTAFFRAYLTAFEFWLSVTLGCMVVMMIRHLTGGAWGLYLRPLLEAGAMLTPLVAVFFLPLLIGLPWIYPWHPGYAGAGGSQWDALTDAQRVWLNPPFFIARAVAYFVVWSAFAFFLNLGPRGPGVPAFEEPPRRFRVVSAIGIAVYGLTITGASLDWSMSLDPKWFSTIYGAMYGGGQLLAGFAFVVLAVSLLAKNPPTQLFRDFGNLLLAFTMIWAYLAFDQFLLIWAGNLPDETVYYQPRMQNGWQWVALAILLGQFALPFLLLLLKRTKVTPRLLAQVAGLSLVMHFVNFIWLTFPSFPNKGWQEFVLAPLLWVGLGGVWLSLFLWRLQRRPFYTAAALNLEVPTYE